MPPMNHAPAESRRKGAPLPEQIAAAIEHVQRPERLRVVFWPPRQVRKVEAAKP